MQHICNCSKLGNKMKRNVDKWILSKCRANNKKLNKILVTMKKILLTVDFIITVMILYIYEGKWYFEDEI